MTKINALDYGEAPNAASWNLRKLFRHIDAVMQCNVISATTTAQPVSPSEGDLYIIPSGKTGALWSTFAVGSLAQYRTNEESVATWTEIVPQEGWHAWVKDTNAVVVFSGAAWIIPPRAYGAVHRMASIAALQAATWASADAPHMVALDYSHVAGDGGGLFRLDSSDTSTADNGGTVILTSTSGTALRYKRVFEPGDLWAQWFGNLSSAFATAVAAALTAGGTNSRVKVPYGSYSLGTQLALLGNQTLEGVGGRPVITKSTNLDGMIDMSAVGCRLINIKLDGEGGSRTGRGILISGNSDQQILRCDIDDFPSACLAFTAADAGQRFYAEDSDFRRTTTTDPAITLPTDVESNGNRYFHECRSVGAILLKFNKGVNTQVIGGAFANLDWSSSAGVSLRAIVVGNRIAAGGGTVAIDGNDTSLVGNVIAGGVSIASGAQENQIAGNVTDAAITDSSGVAGSAANQVALTSQKNLADVGSARSACANLGTWKVLAHSAVAVTHTGDTNHTVLATVVIPAGAMGANGCLRITATFSNNNNGNNKTQRVQLNSTTIVGGFNNTTNVFSHHVALLSNRNSQSSQVRAFDTPSSFGNSANALATTAIDTSVAQNLTFTGQLANSGDTITLERYLVEVFYQA